MTRSFPRSIALTGLAAVALAGCTPAPLPTGVVCLNQSVVAGSGAEWVGTVTEQGDAFYAHLQGIRVAPRDDVQWLDDRCEASVSGAVSQVAIELDDGSYHGFEFVVADADGQPLPFPDLPREGLDITLRVHQEPALASAFAMLDTDDMVRFAFGDGLGFEDVDQELPLLPFTADLGETTGRSELGDCGERQERTLLIRDGTQGPVLAGPITVGDSADFDLGISGYTAYALAASTLEDGQCDEGTSFALAWHVAWRGLGN